MQILADSKGKVAAWIDIGNGNGLNALHCGFDNSRKFQIFFLLILTATLPMMNGVKLS